MAKSKGSSYPDMYGQPVKGVLPDMATPLNIDEDGDVLVPPNDMRAVGGTLGNSGSGEISPDPLGLLRPFGDGTKG
jgi:hypothetical protein